MGQWHFKPLKRSPCPKIDETYEWHLLITALERRWRCCRGGEHGEHGGDGGGGGTARTAGGEGRQVPPDMETCASFGILKTQKHLRP